MKRTEAVLAACLLSLAGIGRAQESVAPASEVAQSNALQKLVASMREAEAAIDSLRLTMTTSGRLRGGLDVRTRGELRVLRGTQPGGTRRFHSRLEYRFGDGLAGSVEMAQTPQGIVLFEQDPAFGVVHVRIPAKIVGDLEWAGEVLKRSDLPGMADARSRSPLGSGTIEDLTRTFDLALEDGTRQGEGGTWLRGARKEGLDQQDPDLPLSDRVELFVRKADRALVEASWFVGEDRVQHVLIEKIALGVKFESDAFRVDGQGQRLQEVADYAPMWEQIEQAIARAETKAPDGAVRPSRR